MIASQARSSSLRAPLPGPSKILERRWRETDAARHRKRLAEAKSTIGRDIHKRQPATIAARNANREMQNECKLHNLNLSVRFTEIERENRILLEKMSRIMSKPSDMQGTRKLKLMTK